MRKSQERRKLRFSPLGSWNSVILAVRLECEQASWMAFRPSLETTTNQNSYGIAKLAGVPYASLPETS